MHRPSSKHNAYRKVGVQTADPGRILLMLYDGCIKFCNQACERIEAKDFEQKGRRITDAQAIIYELIASLNPEAAPELCDQLSALYNFMLSQLNEANFKNDAEPVRVVLRLLGELRGAWAQVVAQKQNGAGAPELAPAAAGPAPASAGEVG